MINFLGRNNGNKKRLGRGEKDRFFKMVDDWKSEYSSVNNLMYHLEFGCSKSWTSRQGYLSELHRFCHFAGKNPDELVALDNTILAQLFRSYSTRFDWKPSCKQALYVLKTFFDENKRIDLDFPKIHCGSRAPRKYEVYVPTMEEALKMMEFAGSLKRRAVIAMLFGTGLRNSTLRALKYGVSCTSRLDFVDHTIKNEFEEGHRNLMVVVDVGMKKWVKPACKNGIFYYTFTPSFATESLELYLKERERKFGVIEDDEFLFPSQCNGLSLEKRLRRPLSPKGLSRIVQDAARQAGLKYWDRVTIHSARTTYNGFLANQKGDNCLSQRDQEFLMGHILGGSMEAYYNKKEFMRLREKYSHLKYGSVDNGSNWLKRTAVFHNLDVDDVLSGFQSFDGSEEDFLYQYMKGKKTQKLISTEELQQFLDEGWTVFTSISENQCVIEKT